MALARIDKGRLSLCFKRNGNIVRCLFGIVRCLFGTVRGLFGFAQGCVSPRGVASGLLGVCSGESFNMAVFDDRMRFAGEP